MSFAALKAKRSARRPQVSHVPQETELAATSPPAEEATPPEEEGQRLGQFLEVRTTQDAGRSVSVSPSSQRLRKGTIILETTPTSAVLSTGTIDDHCSACFLGLHELSVQRTRQAHGGEVAVPKLSRCGGCQVTRYCSKKCQAAAWPTHQTECRALKRLRGIYNSSHASGEGRPWIPEESVRALARVCWERRRRLQSRDEERKYWEPIKGLQSHRDILTSEQREPFAKLAMHLAQYLAAGEPAGNGGEGGPLKAVDMREFGFHGVPEMMDLVCAFATNAFTLSTPSLTPVGVAISPHVAMFNHSCAPNAVVVFPEGCGEEGGMKVVLIEDVVPGQEILTSYIDVSLPRHLRRKELAERYHFECTCTLCVAYEGGKVDPRWCIYHPGCPRAGVVGMPDLSAEGSERRVSCTACGKNETISNMRIRTLIDLAQRIIDADERGTLGPNEAEHVPSLVDALLTLQPASSYPLLPLLRIHALQLTQPETSTALVNTTSGEQTLPRIFDAIRIHTLLVRALGEVLPPFHPSYGIALAELGKLLNVHVEDDGSGPADLGMGVKIPRATTRRLALTLTTLRKALDVLRVGYGSQGGLVGVEMGWIVEGLEKELEMQTLRM